MATRPARNTSTTVERSGENTAQRLIEVATELFAIRGVEGTSIRDLAEAAGVNVAAVHYHFGGKEQLYAAVVDQVFAGMVQLRELLEHELSAAKAANTRIASEMSLERCIRALLSMLFRDNRASWGGAYLQRETIEPSPAMQHVLTTFVIPAWDTSLALIELLRPDLAGTESTRFITSSIIGQCLYYQQNLPVVLATHKLQDITEPFLQKIAAHVTQFSLSAIMTCQREDSQA